MYQLFRKILFQFDPEKVHYFSMDSFKLACKVPGVRAALENAFVPKGEHLSREVFGLRFRNPVGLGAGFDKNARYLPELSSLGFGFVEIGTVTPLPQDGNEKPRLYRLPKDKALINRMGFNNDGSKTIGERLRQYRIIRDNATDTGMIIGGNIGKNKTTDNKIAWKDYKTCFEDLFEVVDYFVVNVSSPNTPGLRELQQRAALTDIFLPLLEINAAAGKHAKPLLLKIAPDLSQDDLDEILDVVQSLELNGIVVANTTIERSGLKTPVDTLNAIGPGGLSGLPLRERSGSLTRYVHEKLGANFPVISSGGIFTAKEATSRLQDGASLVQVWTSFIYEGPSIVKQICNGLMQVNTP